MSDKKTLIIIIVAVIFFALIVITGVLIGVAFILSGAKPSTTQPSPAPVEQTITPPTTPVSKFATDAGLLKIKSDLNTAQQGIDSMDLFEQQITPPVFDLNISIAPLE